MWEDNEVMWSTESTSASFDEQIDRILVGANDEVVTSDGNVLLED